MMGGSLNLFLSALSIGYPPEVGRRDHRFWRRGRGWGIGLDWRVERAVGFGGTGDGGKGRGWRLEREEEEECVKWDLGGCGVGEGKWLSSGDGRHRNWWSFYEVRIDS
jgi:hypothetical protein